MATNTWIELPANGGSGPGTGTVTSVDVSVPAFLISSGGPITTSGTIAISLADESANTVFAGPATGADATPTFRLLVAADIPAITSIGTTTTITSIIGGLNITTRTITTNLVVDTTTKDHVIFCNQSGAISVTLPAPSNGRELIIKDISGDAETNNITIVQHASEMIEGLAASKILQTNYGSITLTSDGTDWWMV